MIAKTSLVLCAASLANAAGVEDVKINSGRLKGAVDGRVASWKGIRFAAPPVGENRWRPPQPVAAPKTCFDAQGLTEPRERAVGWAKSAWLFLDRP